MRQAREAREAGEAEEAGGDTYQYLSLKSKLTDHYYHLGKKILLSLLGRGIRVIITCCQCFLIRLHELKMAEKIGKYNNEYMKILSAINSN